METEKDLLELMKERRSIRRYQEKQVPEEDVRKIVEAGLWAPNAGGGQRSVVVAIRNRELAEKLGRLNANKMDRTKLLGGHVSAEQPSLIDDPTLKSGFYGAPTVCVVFAQRNFLYSIPDAFCAAENMVLEATALGVSSCVVARGEETFENEIGWGFMKEWGVPEQMIARCFVLLGYRDGEAPHAKPRNEGRSIFIEQRSCLWV